MTRLCSYSSIAGLIALLVSAASSADSWEVLRAQMIHAIESDVRDTASYIGVKTLDPRIMEAMAQVPRHDFVPAAERPRAYLNRPLPIGYGQTISQPYIVALMTHLLQPQPDHRVLEVGTGSGYQAAVLSQLVEQVYTIEIIEQLATPVSKRLDKLGYRNIETRLGDGFYGWPEAAPFDSIIVTAAGSQIPPPLLKQIRPGGRMAIPVGNLFSVQYLLLVEKALDGSITTRQILPVRFVPLTGDH